MAIVVEDTAQQLATYVPAGAPFRYPPSADGRPHPWFPRAGWEGNGLLMLQRPGDAYAVWHLWHGPDHRFDGWYLNLQEPYRRTEIGYDTQDLELDLLVSRAGEVAFKDAQLLEERVQDGRFDPSQVEAIRRLGTEIEAELSRNGRWWDESWARFVPDPSWPTPSFPESWELTPPTGSPGPDGYRIAGA